MADYIILTDSSCDLNAEQVAAYGIDVLPLTLTLEGKEYKNWPDERDISIKEVYAKLREGQMITTAAANLDDFTNFFEQYLQKGMDVLYLAFSSGLSSTCNAGIMAARELSERYPDRKIYVVDTLAASLGQGMLVHCAALAKREGKSIEEVRDYIEQIKFNQCHWFTVDDLHFLKRGGRVSAATAVVGSALAIKPVLHMDDAGHLINVSKVRGRKASIKALFDRMKEMALPEGKQTVFISHGDCIEDAEALAEMIREAFGTEDITIGYVGPVIGAHSGPGTLALFFLGEKR